MKRWLEYSVYCWVIGSGVVVAGCGGGDEVLTASASGAGTRGGSGGKGGGTVGLSGGTTGSGGLGGTSGGGGVVASGGVGGEGGVTVAGAGNGGIAPSSGGSIAGGGTTATGGSGGLAAAGAGNGGIAATGGTPGSGGSAAGNGGIAATGGTPSSGGSAAGNGGIAATGGTPSSGGVAITTGGTPSSGGMAPSTGGAAPQGGTGAAGVAGSAGTPACTLVPQSGCPGQACDLTTGGTACRPVTTPGTETNTCATMNDCAAGYLCVGGACLRYCTTDNDCAAPGGLCAITIYFNSVLVPGVTMCSQNCNPITAAGCPTGWGCGVYVAAGGVRGLTQCHTVGTGTQGAACTYDNDCAAGYGCIAFTTPGTGGTGSTTTTGCAQYCVVGSSTCPTPMACYPLNPPAVASTGICH